METSESIKEIATALCEAQAHMTAAKKDNTNPFFKSKYSDLGSVIKAIKEAFYKNGLSYVQSPIMTDSGIGVTTRLMHKSGEWMQDTLILPLAKQDPQAAGSAITYARRYSLQSMAGVPSSDDDGEFAMDRVAVKPSYSTLCAQNKSSIDAIKDGIASQDYASAREAWVELGQELQADLWVAPSKGGCFSTQERQVMQSPEFRTANGAEE